LIRGRRIVAGELRRLVGGDANTGRLGGERLGADQERGAGAQQDESSVPAIVA
jgi:hypothetical protein